MPKAEFQLYDYWKLKMKCGLYYDENRSLLKLTTLTFKLSPDENH